MNSLSWYVVDKEVVGSYPDTLIDNCEDILIGRYVLLKFCDELFTQTEKENIVVSGGANSSEKEYYLNYRESGKKHYDRVIFKKTIADSGNVEYIPMGYATSTVSATTGSSLLWEEIE